MESDGQRSGGAAMSNHIWVVEMWNNRLKKWEPTLGVGLTRKYFELSLRVWRMGNPNDKFRPKKYVRAA